IGLCGGCQPALLMRQSIRPYFSIVESIRFLISKVLETSQRTNVASPGPPSFNSSATDSPSCALRAQKTTFAPACTKVCAQPLPMPLLPPVMITTLYVYIRLTTLALPKFVLRTRQSGPCNKAAPGPSRVYSIPQLCPALIVSLAAVAFLFA